NLAHNPIDDDRRPLLGLGGPLGERGRAKHAHDAQRDRGSEHQSLGVTHVGSLNQNSILRNASMPMRNGIKVPRMPTIRLARIASDSQNRKPLWDKAMAVDSGCSWPAK